MPEISQLQTRELGVPPHDSPELAQFREELRAFDKEWTHLHGNITGSGSNKPIQSEVNESSPEVITDTIAKQIEGEIPTQCLDEEESLAFIITDLNPTPVIHGSFPRF